VLAMALFFAYDQYVGLGQYNRWTKVTAAVFSANPWGVELNGYYNRVHLSNNGVLEVYNYPADPEPIDSGTWQYNSGELQFDFSSAVLDRVYSNFKFDRDGVLHSLTDGNEEKWHAAN